MKETFLVSIHTPHHCSNLLCNVVWLWEPQTGIFLFTTSRLNDKPDTFRTVLSTASPLLSGQNRKHSKYVAFLHQLRNCSTDCRSRFPMVWMRPYKNSISVYLSIPSSLTMWPFPVDHGLAEDDNWKQQKANNAYGAHEHSNDIQVWKASWE